MKCPEGFVLTITAAAIAVAKNLTDDEIALLSSASMMFADVLATIAAARDDPAAADTSGNQKSSDSAAKGK